MRLVSTTVLLKMVPLAIFLVVGACAVKASSFEKPAALSAPAIGQALLLTLFAFQGFETSLCASGEVREPTRTIPRALLLALGAISLLYVAIQLVAQGVLGAALAHSSVPLADAMGRVSPALRTLMLIGAVLSLFGWMTADLLGSPRILFAFARDGLLPSCLGRVGRRGQAPYMAILSYGTLVIALARTGDFARLAAPAALVMAALYVATAAASWQLMRRRVALSGAPLEFRRLGAAALLGGGCMLTMIVLGSWSQIRGLLVLAGLALLVYLVQTRIMRLTAASRQAAV